MHRSAIVQAPTSKTVNRFPTVHTSFRIAHRTYWMTQHGTLDDGGDEDGENDENDVYEAQDDQKDDDHVEDGCQ